LDPAIRTVAHYDDFARPHIRRHGLRGMIEIIVMVFVVIMFCVMVRLCAR